MTSTILLEITNDPYIVKGAGFLATAGGAALVGAAGGIIK